MILKLLSRLMDYPTTDLVAHQAQLDALVQDSSLADKEKIRLREFIASRCAMDLLDWQAEYESLFERGRSLSLLLFEHVHGESRDRGQAMVNLTEQYRQAGLDINVRELPDYIPLYLEFVSTQPQTQQSGWLGDVGHILALLAARLQQRENNYAVIFETLLALSELEIDLSDVKAQIANESRDDSKEAIDKVWQEEAVSFGGDAVNGGCPSQQHKPSTEQDKSQDVPISFLAEAQSSLDGAMSANSARSALAQSNANTLTDR